MALKKKKTNIPAFDQPSPLQKAIQTPQDQTKQPKPNTNTPQNEQPVAQLNFNDPSNVTGIYGDQPINMSKAEYKATIGEGGLITPQVLQARAALERVQLKNRISAQLRKGATIQSITQELLDQEGNKQSTLNTTSNDMLPTSSSTTNSLKNTDNLGSGIVGSVNRFGQSIGAGALSDTAVGRVINNPLPTAASMIDAIGSVFSARKQADVIAAESSLNDAMGAIDQQIELVRAGAQNASTARTEIELAQAALNRLASSQKGLGKANLRYWLGGGDEVEAEIIIKQRELERKQIELIAAEQEGRLSNAKALYGLNQ